MATARKTITRSFRENNLIPIKQTPSDAQVSEALDYLNDTIKSLVGHTIGEMFGDWLVPPSRTDPVAARWPLYPAEVPVDASVYTSPPANARMLTRILTPTTIYFPFEPSDGARMALVNVGDDYSITPITLDANGRLIEGVRTLTFNTATVTPILWFYRADLGTWKRIADLALDDNLPFPDDYNDFFVAVLAARMAPNYGKTPNAITGSIAGDGLTKFRQQYAQTVNVANFPDAAFFGSFQSWGAPGWAPWGGDNPGGF